MTVPSFPIISAAKGGKVVPSGDGKGISRGIQSFLKGSYHENFGKLWLSSIGQDAKEHPWKFVGHALEGAAVAVAEASGVGALSLGILGGAAYTIDDCTHR